MEGSGTAVYEINTNPFCPVDAEFVIRLADTILVSTQLEPPCPDETCPFQT